ncbi:MAG: cellulase family glycosylhydrolase [Verrucomicrobia bacterium]|nr:cellulase family glycosylhydrolase [Verrucomicrobiota bacterium]
MKRVRSYLSTVALIAVLFASCTTGPGDGKDATVPYRTETFAVLDDFEADSAWVIESAENHGLVEYTGDHFTSGDRALKVTAFKMGRLKTAVRKEVDYDLSAVTRLKIDIYNAAGEPVDFAFAFKVRDSDRYFETVPYKLQPGANDGVVFPLDRKTFKPLDGKETYDHWLRGRAEVTRVILIFHEGANFQNEFFVDNLRCDRPYQTVSRGMRPRILNVLPLARTVGLCRRVEVKVDFEGPFSNPFDRDDVAVYAVVQTPSGAQETIYGFLYGYDRARDKYDWRIRYAPREFGAHSYDVHVRTGRGESVSGSFALTVVDDGAPGFIGVSAADRTMFEYTRGRFYYPFGQNICWASDYDYYFAKMHDYGGNWARIWMCPWNLRLEGKDGPGLYDLKVASELDRIVELAEEYGIGIQLVFDYHGLVNDDWKSNPYNVVNGGPCTLAEEFWIHGDAKRFYRKRLEYIVARWGASANIFAWELFNEVDLTRRSNDNDVVAWHQEMGCHLRDIDPYNHLVTTSTAGRDRLTALWDLGAIDFTQAHFYADEVYDRVSENWRTYRTFGKPYFVGEFGRGTLPRDDQVDPRGILLSAGLWLAATTPAAGNAMPWWWDTHIDPNDLYKRFAPVARFLDGVDRRGRHDEFLEREITIAPGRTVRMQGIADRTSAFVYVYDAERIRVPDEAKLRDALPRSFVLTLDGMLGGDYAIEIVRAESGVVAQTLQATADAGRLSIDLPQSHEPLAIKVTRVGALPVQIDLVPQDE